MVERNIIWRIGDGTSVKFWMDRWLFPIDTLQEHALVPILDYMLNETVSEFVNSEGCCDWPRLLNLLPQDICNYIAALAPPSHLAGLDSPAWRAS